MTAAGPGAGWYDDPDREAGQRYWDGSRWTEHRRGTPSGPAPGWYPDPEVPGARRYWDGAQWTEDRREEPAAANLGEPPRVFISYRRLDTGDLAVVVAERLREDLGSDNVFRDTDDLIAGQQWSDVLVERIAGSDATIVLVGPEWAGDGTIGERRIDRPDDMVRREVEAAVAERAGTVPIPVLIDRDGLPELPESLRPLLARHFVFASRESFADPASPHYQHVLVGVWEALRRRHPRGVLIIGDGRAHGALEDLVAELHRTNAIDARELSRFAAGAYLVSTRRARRGARRWPDVIVVAGPAPGAVLEERVRAAAAHPTVRTIAVVGAGAALLAAAAAHAGAGAASLSGASITAFPGAAQVAAAVPAAGSGLSGAAGTLWANAALGVKLAVVAAATVATVATATTITGSPSRAVSYDALNPLPPLVTEEERLFPLGMPDDVAVALGDPSPTTDTGLFSAADGLQFVSREVAVAGLPGTSPVALGPVTLPTAVSEGWIAARGDGTHLVGEVGEPVAIPPGSIPLDDYCYDLEQPSRVIGGWRLTGEDAAVRVLFTVEVEDGSLTGTGITVVVEGIAARELLAELEPDFDLSQCPDGAPLAVTWTS